MKKGFKKHLHFDFFKINKTYLKSKCSQANIISIVLIILIVLILLVIVGNLVYNFIGSSLSDVESGVFSIRLNIEEAKLYENGNAMIKVKRNSGKGNITELKFIFYDEEGESNIVSRTDKLLKEAEKNYYYFSVDEIFQDGEVKKIQKISVIPFFQKNAGMEFFKEELDMNNAPEGLVAWWKFEGDTREFVGENHGTLMGNAKIQRGALILDGDGDYVECENNEKLNFGTDSFSISAWMKNLPEGSSYRTIAAKRGSASSYWHYRVGYNSNIMVFLTSQEGSHYYHNSIYNSKYADEDWHNVIVVRADGEVSHYLDGEFLNSVSDSGHNVNNTQPLFIGGNAKVYPFNGSLDNIMIFNRKLTEKEIKAIYENQKK